MAHEFLYGVLSFISLLMISGFTYILSKKYNFPYTVLLAMIGILLIPVINIPFFSFIGEFKLTPELLFFIFLPVLIFESGYNIKYSRLMQNWKSIGILAVFGLIISALLVGVGMYYLLGFLGWNVPFSICLLFGSVISATDPVAVLSLFKEVGAPRRLSLIFEGESLFNDGTALALFLVILEIINKGVLNSGVIMNGIFMFASMIIGGIVFGGLMGYSFSLIIGKIKNNELVEISLTMVLAHLVFLLSEIISESLMIGGMEIKISGVIATSVAAIVMGNYGRYKISPKVEKYMEKFWSFFAFIANSLVFILMGLILHGLDIDLTRFILPVGLVILVVMIARSVSIYLPIWFVNFFRLEEFIPKTWQSLLAWGSLRGGLGLMMVYMIPNDFAIAGWNYGFTPKEFLLAITIGCIFFTLFIKAPTIGPMLRKLKINDLNPLEKLEKYESEIRIYQKMIDKLNSINSRGYLEKNEYEGLLKKYHKHLDENITNLKLFMETEKDSHDIVRKAVLIHALGVEKQYLKQMYEFNEVNEDIFRYLLTKIERQIDRVERNIPQLRTPKEKEIAIRNTNRLTNLGKFFGAFNNESVLDVFVRYRAQAIISNKVVASLTEMLEYDFGYDKDAIKQVIEIYKGFNELAEMKIKNIYNYDKNIGNVLNMSLVNKHLMIIEEKTVLELYEKEFISPKLYHNFLEEIENEINKSVKIS